MNLLEQLLSSDIDIANKAARNYLDKYWSIDGRLEIPLKGVATKYISISDLLTSYFVKRVAVPKEIKPN